MKPAWPWLTKGLRHKQPLVPDCFSLLETVLVALLLVVTTLSTYRLFQVNIQVSRFSHELDVADRELSGKIQEIRELNIGHFMIGEAIFYGLPYVIKKMRKIINNNIST
jgi:hypothetical protein